MDLLHPDAVTLLHTRFLPVFGMAPELWQEVEVLDRMAFALQEDTGIHWEEPEWMALGFLAGKLVSQICLHKREITVGEEHVWVGGVGGVATHPDWLRHGFATQVLHATEAWMREELKVPFGLLVCADATSPVYAKSGWQRVADGLFHRQGEVRRWMESCVMVLPVSGGQWLPGTIDLCGLPW
jgi:aminoglycoside 2'-N-acetyltransferase I